MEYTAVAVPLSAMPGDEQIAAIVVSTETVSGEV
jgi:hypothetical protein